VARKQTALAHSVVAAAVCRADALPDACLEGFPGWHSAAPEQQQGADASAAEGEASVQPAARAGAQAGAPSAGASDNTAEMWRAQRARKRQRILIGIARASSDGTFMATVDEVLVLPQLQRQGLGRRCDRDRLSLLGAGAAASALLAGVPVGHVRYFGTLMFRPAHALVNKSCSQLNSGCSERCMLRRLVQRVCQQLARQGVYDVGSLVPPSAQPFFAECTFGPDPHGSTGMLLPAGAPLRAQGNGVRS
jgi:hypothetical protein